MLNPIKENNKNYPVKKTSSLTWIKSKISHAKNSISTLLANASTRYAKIAPSNNIEMHTPIIAHTLLPNKKMSALSMIDTHKKSTLSQLDVAIKNFELAGEKCGLPKDTISKTANQLKATIQDKINNAYPNCINHDSEQTDLSQIDIDKIDRQFRSKKNDFGLVDELTILLDKSSYGFGNRSLSLIKSSFKAIFTKGKIPFFNQIPGLNQLSKYIIEPIYSNIAGRFFRLNDMIQPQFNDAIAEEAMASTKSAALDELSQLKAKKGFNSDLVIGNQTYHCRISCETPSHVTSASNKSNGNTCGNLNQQNITLNGESIFRTLRHAVLSAKPNPATTLDPFNKDQTVRTLFESIKTQLKSKQPSDIEQATNTLKKYHITDVNINQKSLEKKLTKQCALMNKAIDIGRAAWKMSDQKNTDISITSLSLLTPDQYRDERGKLDDQVEAFSMLAQLDGGQLKSLGIGEGNVRFNIVTFNFGVNEGENFGADYQKALNDTALNTLTDRTNEKIRLLKERIIENSRPEEKNTLSVKENTMGTLMQKIKNDYDTFNAPYKNIGGNQWWRADKAYSLTAKISFLNELNGDINTCNCASGKDRTGMHVQNAANYATMMRERMTNQVNRLDNVNPSPLPVLSTQSIDVRDSLEEIRDPNTTSARRAELQQRNLLFALESGQQAIQEWNTGSPGYKLYSDPLPNMVTGGQTEGYFMEMFGLTKEEIAEQITMQAKYNAT